MADNVISSFQVALGFEVNQGSLNTAKKSIADYEKAVKDAEKRIEDARWEGAKTEEEIAKLTRETNLREARAALANAQEKEKAEKEQAKKRQERAREFSAAMSSMAIAAAAAATAIGYAVAKVAGSFDNLYFQAQRSGTSVQSLKALGYAFSQTGSTAQEAGALVDSFTTKLRNNPGLRQFVKDLGVDENLEGAAKVMATVEALRKEPYEVGVQHAEMLGISEERFNHIVRQSDAIKEYREQYNATTKLVGLNSEEAAKAATSFQRSMTRLQATVSALGEKLLISLAPALNKVVDAFQKWLTSNPEAMERIIKSITDAIVFFTGKLDELIKSWGQDGGAAFIKKWDEFALRVERIAVALERMVIAGGKLAGFIGAINQYEVTPGAGTISTWLLNKFGMGSGGGGAGAGGGSPSAGADDRNWWQRNMPKALGGKDAPGAGSDGGRSIKPTSKGIDPTVEAYIRKAAAARGINPDTAVGIADGEGLGGSTPDRLTPGDFVNGKPTSFGAFQMHRGGDGSVGTEYEKATGHKVDDPAHWQEQIDFSLDWAKKRGWGAWYGRSKHDIGVREGLNYDPKAAQSGKQVGGNVPPVNGVGGLDQNQGNATRSQSLTAALQKQIVDAATVAGVNAEVYSGGQDESGPNRTGSHRHDHGNAADLKLYVFNPDGSKRYLSMANDADRKVMETFLREGVKAGANGIGAAPDYMGVHGIHIGGGTPNAWGAGGSSANAPDWVRRALDQGMQERSTAPSTPAPTAAKQPDAPKPNMTPGGFDVNKIDPRDLMKAPPLGANSVNNSTANDNRAVHQTFNTNTTINEARNTKEAGRAMEGTFGRMHSMALANAQSAVG